MNDGAIHHKILLAEIGAGFANARSVLALQAARQIRVPRLWLGAFRLWRRLGNWSGRLGGGRRSRGSSIGRLGRLGRLCRCFRLCRSAGVVTEAAAGGAAGSDVPAGVGLAIAGADGAASMPGLGGSGGLDSGKTGFGSLVSSGIALLLSSTDPGFSLGPFTCISLRRSPSGVRVTWHCDLDHIGAQTRDRGTRQHIQPDKQKTPFARYAANGAGSFYAGRHAGYTHSNAPFFQIQMYPTIRMPRKIIISSSPNKPSSLNCTAQGNRKTVSTSKTTNRMATI